jgi:hypothetical protein
MKKLIYIAIGLVAGLAFFSSCDPKIELPVLTEDEYPRIIGQWPEKSGDQLGMMAGYAGVKFTHSIQFTPSNLCEGVWYVNDEEYSHGNSFSYLTETAGDYHIKLVVGTPKYTTSREMILVIRESKKIE